MSRDITLVEVMGIEPTTSSMRPKRSSQLSYTPQRKRKCSAIASPSTSLGTT